METTTIIFLFALFIIVLWCIRQIESVSSYIENQPRSFFCLALFMINMICTPIWLGAIDSGHYLTIILLNIVFIPLILVYILGKNLLNKILVFIEKAEDEEKLRKKMDERKPGSVQDTFEYESSYKDEKGNLDNDNTGSIYNEEEGNTESGSEDYAFSNTERSKGIGRNNRSEIYEESNIKDIKQLGFNNIEERVKSREKSGDLRAEN